MVRRNSGRELNPEDFLDSTEEEDGTPNILGIIGQVKGDEDEEDGIAGGDNIIIVPPEGKDAAAEEQWDDTGSRRAPLDRDRDAIPTRDVGGLRSRRDGVVGPGTAR